MKSVMGIGIDAVEVARFKEWHTYSDKKLLRIFSADEIAYCRACHAKSTERFAVRFAAREALYKALCQAYPETKILFLTLCRQVSIQHNANGQPTVYVNWSNLGYTQNHEILLSLSHTHTNAYAWILIQK